MTERITGEYVESLVAGETVAAFVPFPLPPQPALMLEQADWALLERASAALAELNALASLLPESRLLVYGFMRREAQLSSVIEGTRTQLVDLFAQELGQEAGAMEAQIAEVAACVKSLEFGLQRLGSLPLCNRLIRELHEVLFEHSAAGRQCGEFRTIPVWIGGRRPSQAMHIPPPPQLVSGCIDELEQFLNSEQEGMSAIMRAALVHVQFETIHPFPDGNGRVGRVLINLMLSAAGLLSEPVLSLSLYFKEQRAEYYERLNAVRLHGDWEGWLRFFYRAVEQSAKAAVHSIRQITELFAADQLRIAALGRSGISATRLLQVLKLRPVIDIQTAARLSGLSIPAAGDAFVRLEQLGILQEITGRRRSRIYSYRAYLEILSEGTEPL